MLNRPIIDSDMQTFTFAADGSICWEVEDSWADRSRFKIPSPGSRSAVSPMRWVTGGEETEIHGITIARGMIYLGSGAPGEEPSLVNPLLAIADGSAEPVAPFPTYAGMSPSCRRRYLYWLADGARAPIEIGYVFLYFYGLERQLLLDQGVPNAETSALLMEVNRLSDVYGRSDERFSFYSRGLCDYIRLLRFSDEVPDSAPASFDAATYELPLPFRFGLGRFVRAQQAVPVEWALRWALTDRLVHRRTPLVRCPEVFEKAFKSAYDGAFGEEMLLFELGRVRKDLRVSYSSVSPALRFKRFHFEMEEVPDASDAEEARGFLQSVVEDATRLIEPYSRFLGREPGQAGTLKAYLYLPSFLWPSELQQRVCQLRESVREPLKALSPTSLFALLGYSAKPSPQMVMQLASGLRHLGVGMEPDVREGGRRLEPSNMVVPFALETQFERSPRDVAFRMASVSVSLAASLALADGESLLAARLQVIEDKIATWTHLTSDQQMRLRAQSCMDRLRPVSLAALKPKLTTLTETQGRDVLVELAAHAKADGFVSRGKIRFLEQLCRVFKLDVQLVYSQLFSVSKEPAKAPSAYVDRERVRVLRQETDSVSALLGHVFDVDSSEPAAEVRAMADVVCSSPSDSTASAVAPLLPGLNPSHDAFLASLLTKDQWSRAELEAVAEERQIMLDGALEGINEVALDTFGTMLIDGYDPIYIERELLENPSI